MGRWLLRLPRRAWSAFVATIRGPGVRQLRRAWPVFVAAAVALAAIIGMINDGASLLDRLTSTPSASPTSGTSPMPSASSGGAVPTTGAPSAAAVQTGAALTAEVHDSDTVAGMFDPEGFDFDAGQVLDQEAQPVEISGCGDTSDLCVMSERSAIRVIAAPGPETKAACQTPAPADRGPFTGMYGLMPGSRICVITNEGRIAMMILTRAPSSTDQTLNFRWITWK